MKQFAKVVASHLSPTTYDVICGVGIGYDPIPREYHDAFVDSDFAAFIADTEALYLDWCHVHDTFVNRSAPHLTEVRHHGRIRKPARAERLREDRVA